MRKVARKYKKKITTSMYFDIYFMKHGAKIQNVLKFWQKICYFVKGILMKNLFLQKMLIFT